MTRPHRFSGSAALPPASLRADSFLGNVALHDDLPFAICPLPFGFLLQLRPTGHRTFDFCVLRLAF